VARLTLQDVVERTHALLEANPPDRVGRIDFLRARYDAGLAWVHYPDGLGGLGVDPAWQPAVDAALEAAHAPDNRPAANVIGLGMAAPTLLRFADRSLCERWLRPLWVGEQIWCQLFSEPGAGSDLANVATRAVRDGSSWVVNGQKVWTSLAHDASYGLLLTRTDSSAPKHQGLTYFVLDMSAPGVDVRPLRQLTGEAEFNEVFLDDVRVPDENRLADVGDGWRVARHTLANERVAIGGEVSERGAGPVARLIDAWSRLDHRPTHLYDAILRAWVEAEALRLTSARLAQHSQAATPGPEGSALKQAFAALAQRSSSLLLDLCPDEALRYDDWSLRRPDLTVSEQRVVAYPYLRARANSIEGGTSEVMRNIIAERVLGLPREPSADRDVPWQDTER
jgi:alkylation response protein AidB-like acyl-CoA dehydrogenase